MDTAKEYARARMGPLGDILDGGGLTGLAFNLIEQEIENAFRAGMTEVATNILDRDKKREVEIGK